MTNLPQKPFYTSLTIFLAFISGLSTLMVSRSFNRSVLAKNEVAILESQIANQWNYYSEKSVRMDIERLSHALGKRLRAEETHEQAVELLESKRKEILGEARSLEAKRAERNSYSETMGKIAHLFGSGLALLQISVMLTSLCSIRPSRSSLAGGVIAGTIGLGMFITGLIQFFTSGK